MFYKKFAAYGSRRLLEQAINDWLGKQHGIFVVSAAAGELRLFLECRQANKTDRHVPATVRVRLFKPMSERNEAELELNRWAQHDCKRKHAWCANDHFLFVFYEPKEHS